jgi:hypothetical protein
MTTVSPAANPSFNRTAGDMFGNSPQPAQNIPRSPHRIARVEWPQGVKPSGYDACRLVCECGWDRTVGEFADHKLAVEPVRRTHVATHGRGRGK